MNKINENLINLNYLHEKYKIYYISIEGNIGSGKSFFLNRFENVLPFSIYINEPIEYWTNNENLNFDILDEFYKNKKERGFLFQFFVLTSKLDKICKSIVEFTKTNQNDQNIILIFLERSFMTDYLFAKNLFKSGFIDKVEWNIYKVLNQEFSNLIIKRHLLYIYLKTTPDICFERMNNRNRTQESKISIDYLKLIHEQHQKFFNNKTNLLKLKNNNLDKIKYNLVFLFQFLIVSNLNYEKYLIDF